MTPTTGPSGALVDEQIERIVRARASAFVTVPLAVLSAPALAAGLRARGWFVATLDRAPVVDKPTLMHALYQSGRYPAGFGFNWDALADALRDLEWLEPATGVAFIWHDPDVLEARSPEAYATLREIVDDAHSERVARGHAPLRFVLPAR
ncbi:MAG: barstar family protein [Acidobacteriota bacterium]